MKLHSLDNIGDARAFTKSLATAAGRQDFSQASAREVIAQALVTLASYSKPIDQQELVEQIDKPRQAFDQDALPNHAADNLVFDLLGRQKDHIRKTAQTIVRQKMHFSSLTRA
ncbi:hypothetical protein [Aureimonas sp. SK2]|uniref:hypothetical protein n=1 Tax=Aureimonas sp. SK2 TaxID=3015992 RepID=UPI0024440552|nr:hypothetical protein [Aureimonas sp. SK2]